MLKYTVLAASLVLIAGCDAPTTSPPVSEASVATTPVAAPKDTKAQAIVAADRFILAASKVGMADVLATFCPRYSLNAARRTQIEKQTVAQADADTARIGGNEVKRQINLRSVSQRKKFTSGYKAANGLRRYSGQDDFCRVADKEYKAQGFIGKLLNRA